MRLLHQIKHSWDILCWVWQWNGSRNLVGSFRNPALSDLSERWQFSSSRFAAQRCASKNGCTYRWTINHSVFCKCSAFRPVSAECWLLQPLQLFFDLNNNQGMFVIKYPGYLSLQLELKLVNILGWFMTMWTIHAGKMVALLSLNWK